MKGNRRYNYTEKQNINIISCYFFCNLTNDEERVVLFVLSRSIFKELE